MTDNIRFTASSFQAVLRRLVKPDVVKNKKFYVKQNVVFEEFFTDFF
jgi:hypothetical protein